jgi:hypothetical protein
MKNTFRLWLAIIVTFCSLCLFKQIEIKADDEVSIVSDNVDDEVFVGDTVSLDVIGTDNILHWSTSRGGYDGQGGTPYDDVDDDNVAMIDLEGNATMFSPGYLNVRMKYNDYCFSFSAELLRQKTERYYYKYIKQPYLSSYEIRVGEKKKEQISLIGAKAVSYKSSNKKICKISKKGIIKGVKKGIATIKIKDSLGREYSCIVLVGDDTKDEKGIKITKKRFPDTGFRKYVSEIIDKDSNGYLSKGEIYATISIGCGVDEYEEEFTWKIKSLKGIEFFTELQYLNCSGMKLKELSLSKNTKLYSLRCDNNHLKKLDISHNSELKALICNHNELSEIDLSNNGKLVLLQLDYNNLNELILCNNPDLEQVWCSYNKIMNIKLSGCNKLKELYCWKNNLTTIDFSTNSELQIVDLSSNYDITELDISQNKKLVSLDISHLENVNTIDLSNNPKLRCLNVDRCYMSDLDVTQCPELEVLSCDNLCMKTLDLSKNLELKAFHDGCQGGTGWDTLNYIDVSNNTKLMLLDLRLTHISELDVSHNPDLRVLEVGSTYIKTLNLSNNKNLEQLNCYETSLNQLDLSENVKLEWLWCSDCNLDKLDVSNNKKLMGLYCDNNNIKALELSKNKKLEYLHCNGNKITKIDISNNKKIEKENLKVDSETEIIR